MSITETCDPQALLVPPTGPAQNFADSLRWRAGALLGGLDWLVAELTGFSAIAWLVEPVAGDWVGLEKGAQAWRASADATLAVRDNLQAAVGQAAQGWAGPAAEAFGTRLTGVADSFGQYAEGCGAMAEVTSALLDLCKATAETLAGILGFIGDYLTRLMIEAAIPVAGWIAGAVDGAVSSALLIRKLQQGYRLIETVVTLVERFATVLQVIKRIAVIISTLARTLRAAVNIRTIDLAGDATATAFGVTP